jgi:hypothetical protein
VVLRHRFGRRLRFLRHPVRREVGRRDLGFADLDEAVAAEAGVLDVAAEIRVLGSILRNRFGRTLQMKPNLVNFVSAIVTLTAWLQNTIKLKIFVYM